MESDTRSRLGEPQGAPVSLRLGHTAALPATGGHSLPRCRFATHSVIRRTISNSNSPTNPNVTIQPTFEFGFVGLPEAPPAKEIEGLGQPPSFESSHLIRGGGKGTSAYEMVLSPLPRDASGCMKNLGYQQLFGSRLS